MLQSSFITSDFINQIITEVADIFCYMHHQKPYPMIYQDLKPEHILIGETGIKLIDFGIASYMGEPGNKFQNYGTPAFCAPEKSKGSKISIQTDVYAIGKLLESLLCAKGEKGSRSLMHIVKKATNAELSERYLSIEAFMEDFTDHMQSEKNSIYQKHLLKKIVAAGSQPHIGTTHISISFTEYLNRQGIYTVYREKNQSEAMRMAIKQGGFAKDGGLYRKKNFFGMPAYGEGVDMDIPRNAVEILDYGSDVFGAVSEEADLFLFIIGSRQWETLYADLAFEKVQSVKGLQIVSNYGDNRKAKHYAKKYEKTVYCFPLDADPFFLTEEKITLFQRLLEQRGKSDKKHWNCRKYPRQWGNALIRGIGKLYGKRTK